MSLHKNNLSLEKYIEGYEKVIIFDCKCKKVIDLFNYFINYKDLGKITSKIVILSTEKINVTLQSSNVDVCVISKTDLTFLLNIYRMYEFSDRITLISESSQYPSLLNYILTGMLTEEEFIDALLH